MMRQDTFRATCHDAFAQLQRRFGLTITKFRCDTHVYECVLQNETTGVKVVYEPRQLFVFVQVCELIDNKIVRHHGEMKPDSELHCFDVDALLMLRKSEYRTHSLEIADLENYNPEAAIWQYAADLEEFGSDVLTGNFEVFRDLDQIVKVRARQAAFDKWGDRAHEFGW